MTDIYGLTYESMRAAFTAAGEKPSRADTVFPALYCELADGFDGLALKQETLVRLSENFSLTLPELAEVRTSDTADKYLWRLADGCTVESVLMKHGFGYNVCVSTQVGCNMGCAFCTSGRLKRRRDLTVSEMVGQVIGIRRHSGAPVSGISIMGIGEPMENLDNVLGFTDIMMCPKGMSIGTKHITLSTCGVVPGIYKLMESRNPVNLAISLHAPDDELRGRLMPITRKYPIAEVMKAAADYSLKLNRRVTIEYVMLDGVNDSNDCALRLAQLIGSMNAYVNLIRYNPGACEGFSCSPHERIMGFYDTLKKNGVGVTMRRSLGDSIGAACGQLSAQGADGTPILDHPRA